MRGGAPVALLASLVHRSPLNPHSAWFRVRVRVRELSVRELSVRPRSP